MEDVKRKSTKGSDLTHVTMAGSSGQVDASGFDCHDGKAMVDGLLLSN